MVLDCEDGRAGRPPIGDPGKVLGGPYGARRTVRIYENRGRRVRSSEERTELYGPSRTRYWTRYYWLKASRATPLFAIERNMIVD